MSHAAPQTFPPGVLIGAGGIIGITMALILAMRVGVLPPMQTPQQERVAAHTGVVAARSLSFADRADGALVATDSATHAVVTAVAPGTKSGFIRGVLRGMARERRMNGIGEAPPFTITQWRDGALTLTDPSTGRVIELGSFGPDNRAAFAALLTTKAAA